MVEFKDPVTDVSYDPVGDPVGTLKKSGMIVAGLTMTLLLFNIASGQLLPQVSNFLSSATGGLVDSGDADNILGTNGGGL